jgi:hypothetical protein
MCILPEKQYSENKKGSRSCLFSVCRPNLVFGAQFGDGGPAPLAQPADDGDELFYRLAYYLDAYAYR